MYWGCSHVQNLIPLLGGAKAMTGSKEEAPYSMSVGVLREGNAAMSSVSVGVCWEVDGGEYNFTWGCSHVHNLLPLLRGKGHDG